MNLSVEGSRLKRVLSALIAGATALVMGSLAVAPVGTPQKQFPEFRNHGPKVKVLWVARGAKDKQALYLSALNGMQMAPPHGSAKLVDGQFAVAVDYTFATVR